MINCDTIVSLPRTIESTDIVVEVFESRSPDFSYIDRLLDVTQIKEKVPFSNLACTGNYFFKSPLVFWDGYRA